MAKGQNEGRYLIVKASLADDQWKEVFISPVGVVDKTGADPPDIRIINDFSYPDGASVNDYTDRSHFPEISYNPPRDIARRIYTLRRDHPYARILLMLGDVAGAFRHVPVHAEHVHMFAFIIDGYLVIDMACGFGWCGSPAWYFLPGALINGLYEAGVLQSAFNANLEPPLQGSFWCDDHTCVELDQESRCFIANLVLRRAMATVLGPTAINERKFTKWKEQGRSLGLDWDTTNGTVTIPTAKIIKAQRRVTDILEIGTVTKTSVLSLLGSLRHLATCCPPARAFFQRIQDVAVHTGRYGRRKLTPMAVEDLRWFQIILQQHARFNRIPVEHFAQVATPAVHVHMDASNDGLCALVPSLRQFIRVRFTRSAKDATNSSVNSINVRELQSAVLSALIWGPTWAATDTRHPTHICFWIDNVSAVSWSQRRASRQPRAQLYNRLLSLAEFNYSLVCTAAHVPGVENIMADAGSRAWTASDPLYTTWTNLSCGWTQIPVVEPYDDLLQLWERCSADMPSLTLPVPNKVHTGDSGPGFLRS